MKRLASVRASRSRAVAMRAPRILRDATALALSVMLASSIEGCTAIGFAVGAQADSRNGKGGPELLTKVNVGQPVTLVLHDGRKLQGRFLGWSRESGVASSTTDRPSLRGESVKLATARGKVSVHTEEVAAVSVSVSHGKVKGLLIGAAVDAITILAFAYGMGQSAGSAYGR